MSETIANLVNHAPTFSVTENGSAVHDYFEQNKEAEGVVIVDSEKPVGIIMRNDFYQKLGKQFGYSLYMKRDVTLIMKPDIVCVDISCDMAKFGFRAMNRSTENLYDHIIVVKNDQYVGIVSISQFLIEMSKTKEREIELLNNQQQILKQANEAEKFHRIEMEQKNISIKNLLNNAGQGFLSFGSDLIISDEHSKECDEIFGFSAGNKNFLEIFKEFLNHETILIMQSAFENIFLEQNKARNNIYLSILPQEIIIKGKYIKIEYKVISNQSEKSVMIILTDITDKKALELKNAEEKNNIKLIIKAISNKAEINQAMEALRDFFTNGIVLSLNSGQDTKIILHNIYRLIHTMKGDFSLNSLHHTSEALHQLEDALAEMIKNIDTVSLDDITQFANKINSDHLLEKDSKIITEALGNQFFEKDDTFTVSQSRLREIKKEIRKIFKDNDQAIMAQLLDNLINPNIKDIIRNYNDYTKAVAGRLGKNIRDFKISGDEVYIDRNIYTRFTKSLVHIFRNIADHGIETPEERMSSGKQEYGEITCLIEKYEDKVVLNIADDGRGIDIDAIRKKALEKGIYTESEINSLSREEIPEIIFLDDFSTKNTVDMLSGRGVGLAAVRSEVEAIGGTIKVETEMGQFTNFKISVPLN